MLESCHECGGAVVQERGPQQVQMGEWFISVEADYQRCTECDEIYYRPGQMDAMQRAAAEQVRRKEGLLSPAEIEEIRASYGWSRADLGRVIKTQERMIAHWETGSFAPPGPADILLRILRDRPDVVDQLARERGVPVRFAEEERLRRRAAGGM